MAEYYLWIKVIHILFFTSWMAGLFYLPRLFVYHAENIENSSYVSVVKIQEHKLFFFITSPAMWLTLLSGLAMLHVNADFINQPWMLVKLAVILLMMIFHYSMRYFLIQFRDDLCVKSGKFFRIYNEVPTILMLVVVIMVVVKPFA